MKKFLSAILQTDLIFGAILLLIGLVWLIKDLLIHW